MGLFSDDTNKPEVIIPYTSFQKMMDYATIADGEISGFADVEWDNDRKALIIGDVYLLKQEATGVDVEMDPDTINEFNLEMIKLGKTQLPRVWWHSHDTMGVFFSSTDTGTIDELSNDTFMLAIVVNKRQEMKTCLKICQPIPMIINDLPVTVDYTTKDISEELRREVKDKVKTKTFKFFSPEKKKDDFEELITHDFPKKTKEIKKLIKSKKLSREWNSKKYEYVWINKKSKIMYVDAFNVINIPLGDDWDYKTQMIGGDN